MTGYGPSIVSRRAGQLARILAATSLLGAAMGGLAADPAEPDTLGKPRSGSVRATPAPLADPTRPAGFAPVGAAASSASRGGIPLFGKPNPEPVAPPAVLQSVRVPATGAATAVVDGRLVMAGDTVDGSTVVSIDQNGLVLRTARGEERKWLLGGASKQAPGSILINRSTSFVPAPIPPEPKASDATDASDATRATSTTAKATSARNLTLAGSN